MDDVLVNGPRHIGVIIDGNRRWAKARNMPAVYGHTKGADALENLVKFANKLGLEYLTVYAFSTENWNRSKEEVTALMKIFENFVDKFLNKSKEERENIKIKLIGERYMLPEKLLEKIEKAEAETIDNNGTCFNLAFSYGGRQEILHSVKEIANKVKQGLLEPDNITLEDISNNLYTVGEPDVDLIIRTSGEYRLSNFLTWQGVYAELLFLNKCWPDFTSEDLIESINEFKKRTRRFGGN